MIKTFNLSAGNRRVLLSPVYTGIEVDVHKISHSTPVWTNHYAAAAPNRESHFAVKLKANWLISVWHILQATDHLSSSSSVLCCRM